MHQFSRASFFLTKSYHDEFRKFATQTGSSPEPAMHRSQPYPAQRPPATMITPMAIHSFVYIHDSNRGSWCFPVHLYSGTVTDGIDHGAILWNGNMVPCKWAITAENMYVKFHWAGNPDLERETTYSFLIQAGPIKVWRTQQLGGAYLIQYN